MTRNSHLYRMRGSTVSYIIVGIVLSISLLGSVLLIQNRSRETSKPTPAASNEKSNHSKTTPASTSPGSPAPPNKSSNEVPNQPTKKSATEDNIPATGPSENLVISIFMASVLIALSAAYYQSRTFA